MAEREADGKRGGRVAAMESLGWQRSVHAGGGLRRDYRDIHDLAVRPRAAHPWRLISGRPARRSELYIRVRSSPCDATAIVAAQPCGEARTAAGADCALPKWLGVAVAPPLEPTASSTAEK